MPDQAHFWSQAAACYEQAFVDPYRDSRGTGSLLLVDEVSNGTVGAAMIS